VKIWQKLKEKDPSYRRGYIIPVCIHCNVISGLIHADDYMKRGEYVCGNCMEEGPRLTFSTKDLMFAAEQIQKLVEHIIRLKQKS
jgi:superfamily II helicase